ncbi:TolC family protein [Pedobacter sp. GR22-6]|uniref:TolC family protein n=1 Tax=Pedobacter sp. GR22-6 TaxID=3127957 RepID=UPI00307F0938
MSLTASAQEKWSLSRCIEYAYENNLEVMSSKVNNGVKVVELKMARNERLPDLNSYMNMYSKFGQAQDVFGTTRRNDNLNAEAGFSSDVLIYNHSKLQNEVKRADLLVEVSEEELASIKRNIAMKVIEGYLSIQLNKEIARAVDSSAFYANLQYEKAVKTTQAGTTALTVQYEAQANLAREKQKLQKAKQDIERARISLAQLLQIENSRAFDVAEESSELSALSQTLTEAVDKTTATHPEMKRLSLLRQAAELDHKIIRAGLYPTVKGSALVGSLYFNSLVSSGDMLFFDQMKNNFAQQVAVTVSIPIFNKGRVKNQIAKNNLALKQNAIDVLQRQATIKQEIEKMYFDYQAYMDQFNAAQDVLNSARTALSFTSKSFDAGKSSIYDLNVSRSNYLTAESEMLQAKYNGLFVSKMIRFYIEQRL